MSFGLLLVRTCVSLCPNADPVPDQVGAARGRGRGRGNWRAGRRGGGGRRGRWFHSGVGLGSLLPSSDDVRHSLWCHTTFDQTCIHDSLYMLLRWCIHVLFWTICSWCILWTMYVYSGCWCISCWYDAMYDIISAFQCYTISVDVYFPFHCTLWMACLTFLLILCYCCCAHDNDVSHTLHREWGVTAGIRAPGSNTCGLGYLSGSFRT